MGSGAKGDVIAEVDADLSSVDVPDSASSMRYPGVVADAGVEDLLRLLVAILSWSAILSAAN